MVFPRTLSNKSETYLQNVRCSLALSARMGSLINTKEKHTAKQYFSRQTIAACLQAFFGCQRNVAQEITMQEMAERYTPFS